MANIQSIFVEQLRLDGWVGGWESGWVDGWVDRWEGGSVGGWVDRYLLMTGSLICKFTRRY